MESNFYPVFLSLRAKRVLVVGGGSVGERKVETLLKFNAVIKVIAINVTRKIYELARKGEIELELRQFKITDLDGIFLAYACTSDSQLNSYISQCAREKGILVNVVDNPEESTFIVPSILQRGDLLIGISTSGKSPALASYIKDMLEEKIGEEYGELAKLLGEYRQRVMEEFDLPEKRKDIFYRMIYSDIIEILRNKNLELARKRAEEIIQKAKEEK